MAVGFCNRAGRVLLAASLGVSSACTTRPESVSALYVSPVIYQGFQCEQLTEEHRRLTHELNRVAELQRENATGDAVMLTVGLVILWPVLIGMAATKDRKNELGKLKGEFEAVEAQMKMKQCPGAMPAATPPTEMPAAPKT